MEGKKTAKRKTRRVRINVTLCRYEVVRRAARARGWKLVTDEKPEGKPTVCNLHWIDVPDILPTFKGLLPYQKVNHFPGMANLACKSKLARNLERMKKLFPAEYDFVPRTWILPFDQYEFQQNFNSDGESQRTFIVKPDHMCQGRGVFLTRKLAQIPKGDVLVAQQYVARPLLIDGKKFDLRIYVLVTSCAPLRVYIFKDGLVRMCTADYATPNAENLEHRFMHLTNYAVNKHSNNFEADKGDGADGKGSKRSLKWFFAWLKEIFPSEKIDTLWDQIGDICLKAILSVQPTLAQEYRSTFTKYTRRSKSASRFRPEANEMNSNNAGTRFPRPGSAGGNVDSDHENIADDASEGTASNSSIRPSCSFALLGMDVLIDEQLKPWLLEVNHLPSFGCDSPLDWSVKEPLISQTFDLLNLSTNDKERYESEHTQALQRRLYGGISTSISGNAPTSTDNQHNELPPLVVPSPRTNASEDPAKAEKEAQLPLQVDQLREVLTKYYSQFNVDRLGQLDQIVSKYADNQGELSRSLEQKYGKSFWDFALDPVGNNPLQQDEHVEQGVEEEKLIDFVRIYPPPPSSLLGPKYRKLLDAAQQYIDEVQLRFSAPLQHRRPEIDSNGVALPPLKGAQKKEQLGRDCFGFSGTDKALWLVATDKKPLVVPGPMQVAAAHRLMLGHSSQKLSIKPPTPPEPLPSRSGTPLSYGHQYRERLATHKNKPTLAVSQVSFSFDGPF